MIEIGKYQQNARKTTQLCRTARSWAATSCSYHIIRLSSRMLTWPNIARLSSQTLQDQTDADADLHKLKQAESKHIFIDITLFKPELL